MRSPDGFTPDEAADALDAVSSLTRSAVERSLYSDRFSALLATWAGLLGVAVGTESGWMLPLLFAGIFGLVFQRNRQGAWIHELRSRGELWLVLVMGLLVGALFIAGNVGLQEFGIAAAPWVAGGLIGVILYSLLYVGRRSHLKSLAVIED